LEIAPDETEVERHPPAVTLERGLQPGVLAHQRSLTPFTALGCSMTKWPSSHQLRLRLC